MGTLLMCSLGLSVGLALGAALRCSGSLLFEWTLLSMATFSVCHGYVVIFKRCSSSADIPGFCALVVVSLGSPGLFMAIGRLSVQMQLSLLHHCVLFGGTGTASFLFAHMCISLLHEDERKHFFGLCGPGGELLGVPGCNKSNFAPLEALLCFASWIITWQWWRDCSALPLPEGKQPASASTSTTVRGSTITIYNRSLKQVKVCLYSSVDLFCWIPFGGVSGQYVGFLKAEDSHTFFLPHDDSPGGPGNCFTVKVFQPCIFDQELACYTGAQGGQCLAFVDIEGMIRRARPLTSSAPVFRGKSWSNLVESSEDEAGPIHMDSGGIINTMPKGSAAQMPLSSRSGLTRISSAGNLMPQGSQDQELRPVRRGQASSPSCKTAGTARSDEIVVRNRSSQEIRALLFHLDDYSCLVPLVGRMTACGDVILPENERHIVPRDVSRQEFTLKLYGVGPGARELTYFTVVRGHTYTFCNSLLV